MNVNKAEPSLLQFEIPVDTNPSLPVWDAIRDQEVIATWSVLPYSISVSVTPATLQASTRSTTASITGQKTTPTSATCKPPVARFHTRSNNYVDICDAFLLNKCVAGQKCQMHHTLYPFHWQFWSARAHKWIDIPPPAQMLLEKKYCDVNKQGAYIRDWKVQFFLDFDTFKVTGHDDYTDVRRLANSDNPVINQHFPAKLLFYWWDDLEWTSFGKKTSKRLQKMKRDKNEGYFYIGLRKYKLDFTTMQQTNVQTGFRRNVRCRPIYRSPDSLQPYHKTVSQGSEPPRANFSVDALKDFTSWYPPVWCLAEEHQDCTVVDVPKGSNAYKRVLAPFFETMSETSFDIIKVQQIQNLFQWDKYQRHKLYMMKRHPQSMEPLERHLFHGTSNAAVEAICLNNFDPRLAGTVNGASTGYGTYFAVDASVSHSFSSKSANANVRTMFLAKVLVGRFCEGQSSYKRPPLNTHGNKHQLFDTCVDNLLSPTSFIVFDSCQCYPYYVIKYKYVPTIVEL